MDQLKLRFDPSTTVTDANELYQLFHLRRHIWELDKLLDDASALWRRILERKLDVSRTVYYFALMGIIPPQYERMHTTYETTVCAATAEGKTPVYDPGALIVEL